MSNSVKHIFEILTEVTIHKASGNKSCVTNTILSHPELIQHVLQFLETSDTKICVSKSLSLTVAYIFSVVCLMVYSCQVAGSIGHQK